MYSRIPQYTKPTILILLPFLSCRLPAPISLQLVLGKQLLLSEHRRTPPTSPMQPQLHLLQHHTPLLKEPLPHLSPLSLQKRQLLLL